MSICLIRICDVSLGTIRIILISKGNKYIAPVLGFLEVLIWLLAISKIIQNLDNVPYYRAYASSFALGNFIGIIIEEKMAVGIICIKIITKKSAEKLIGILQSQGYGTTSVRGQGMEGHFHILYTIIKRHNPMAFYTLEDIRFVSKTLAQLKVPAIKNHTLNLLKRIRKGK